MRSEPTELATASGCRPFHGLDGPPNLTWGCGLRLHPRLYSDARSAGLKLPKYLVYRALVFKCMKTVSHRRAPQNTEKSLCPPGPGSSPSTPDFPEAKRGVKKALILWLVLTVAHIAVMAKTS